MAIPDGPVKTNRKAQNYSAEVRVGVMQTKVKPLFRDHLKTCKMLGMCNLQMARRALKIEEGVARKLFATIRYRFSHLDNGLIWKTSYGQVRRRTEMRKCLKICELISGQEPLRARRVPVVVAD